MLALAVRGRFLTATSRPLLEVWPAVRERLPLALLGEFPTPVEPLSELARAVGRPGLELFEKRDDISSPVYGGNKVRTLEVLMGQALSQGASHIFSTGAFGSNHAAATVLHAPRVGLKPGVMLFPQPRSWAALENLRVVLAQRPLARALWHWSLLPFGMVWTAGGERLRGHRPFLMVPGGATPFGALGYVSAALELGQQVQAGVLPRPKTVVIGVGSTCTSAGLLVGFAEAARIGLGFRDERGRPAPPKLVSVRVTPWPVTSKARIVRLATRTSRLLADLSGKPELARGAAELAPNITVDAGFLGRGYGYSTPSGVRALALWHDHVHHELDTTYSAKSAAAVLHLIGAGDHGPLLFWATKSSVPLPVVTPRDLETAPALMLRWMARAERELASRGELPRGYLTLEPGIERGRGPASNGSDER